MIPKNYYEEILDGYFPEANLDDKELTACRRIARKHLERGDKLNDKLENAYKKLPFKNDTPIDLLFINLFWPLVNFINPPTDNMYMIKTPKKTTLESTL